MKSKTAFILLIVGMLMVFGAVGGMEDPAKEHLFVEQLILTVVGLAIMACGALGLEASEHYD